MKTADSFRNRFDRRLPTLAALRRMYEDEPESTVEEFAEYFDVRPKTMRQALRDAGITIEDPRKSSVPDDVLRPAIEAAAETGYGPLVEKFGVSKALLSKRKKRWGIVWPSDLRKQVRDFDSAIAA